MSSTNNHAFYLDEYIESHSGQPVFDPKKVIVKSSTNQLELFQAVCNRVNESFVTEWEAEEGKGNESSDKLLLRQKKAIIGYPSEVNFFKNKISDFLKKNGLNNEWYPDWYSDLTTAIFEENFGIAGLYEWMIMPDSSSAKLIGERIYFLIDGKLRIQKQTISKDRVNQLITALLLKTPDKSREADYFEVYMLNGIRITIYEAGFAKEASIVFRKYTVDIYSFEEQARLGTIPIKICPMLKAMVKIGYNVGFVGPVRSAKTTFLTTWQSYEDQSLEGIQIETDPEIPLHLIMPQAPVIQLVADGDDLLKITKPLMRSDGDYLIMAEARDGVALKIALDVTRKGTKRVKLTYHTSDPIDFCYDVASEITQSHGGNIWATTIKMAKGYHYLFEFVQLKNKSQKRLKGIYEIRYDPNKVMITMHQICKYSFKNNDWTYSHDIGQHKEDIASQEDPEAYQVFSNELYKLAQEKPMIENHVFELPYMNIMRS